ncbi:hypothetical protein Baya_12903 [Bagarius yarrelli]|uniref:Uncharacterized protein n=1 Tax=Bagarius yarrelli TaxID=175774 RepID=A0A556V4G0_BAGYA|nr:hypothetical protein Baya_12903 [Bagarius yarrelli]
MQRHFRKLFASNSEVTVWGTKLHDVQACLPHGARRQILELEFPAKNPRTALGDASGAAQKKISKPASGTTLESPKEPALRTAQRDVSKPASGTAPEAA